HPLGRDQERWQEDSRLRNPAEQILLLVSAPNAREGLARQVLEAGEGRREDVGRVGQRMSVSTQFANQWSIFGDSPAAWCVDRIRDRLDGIVGGEWGDDPDAHDEGVVLPVIRVADIRGLDVATDDLTLRRVKESKLPGRLIEERTIL